MVKELATSQYGYFKFLDTTQYLALGSSYNLRAEDPKAKHHRKESHTSTIVSGNFLLSENPGFKYQTTVSATTPSIQVSTSTDSNMEVPSFQPLMEITTISSKYYNKSSITAVANNTPSTVSVTTMPQITDEMRHWLAKMGKTPLQVTQEYHGPIGPITRNDRW